MQELRIGVIGTGVAARILHWPALQQLSDRYRIVAVANRSHDKGAAFADLVGLDRSAVYSDYRELLARDDLDVVDLVLPPLLNYQVARAAAEAGINVICEKPIAVTMEEARALADLPSEFGVQVLIAENFRYDNAVLRAKSLIDEGLVAPPFMMSYQWMQPVPPDDEIASRPWRRDPVHAGGCLSDHGVHMIDVARYLMGEIRAVQAFTLDLRDYLGGLDTAVYSLQFESSAVGSMQWSFSVASERVLLQLWSDDGTIWVDSDEVRVERPGQPVQIFPIVGPSSFVNEFADFYEALVRGKRPVVSVQDALRDLEVILAAHRSSITEEVVVIDRERRP